MTRVNKCFVVMPFDPYYDAVYNDAIQPAVSALYTCERSDDPFRLRGIIRSIIHRIFQADIIIADISNNNPNVFYELGIAHTVSNKVIVICEKTNSPIPFDLKDFTIVFYDKTAVGLEKLKIDVENIAEDIDEHTAEPSNPVQLFRPVKYALPLVEHALLEARSNRLFMENVDLKHEKKDQHSLVEIMLILTVTTEHERNILGFLASEERFQYEKMPAFIQELKHLRALKLIETLNHERIDDLPEIGCLKEHIRLTRRGVSFLQLMEFL